MKVRKETVKLLGGTEAQAKVGVHVAVGRVVHHLLQRRLRDLRVDRVGRSDRRRLPLFVIPPGDCIRVDGFSSNSNTVHVTITGYLTAEPWHFHP